MVWNSKESLSTAHQSIHPECLKPPRGYKEVSNSQRLTRRTQLHLLGQNLDLLPLQLMPNTMAGGDHGLMEWFGGLKVHPKPPCHGRDTWDTLSRTAPPASNGAWNAIRKLSALTKLFPISAAMQKLALGPDANCLLAYGLAGVGKRGEFWTHSLPEQFSAHTAFRAVFYQPCLTLRSSTLSHPAVENQLIRAGMESAQKCCLSAEPLCASSTGHCSSPGNRERICPFLMPQDSPPPSPSSLSREDPKHVSGTQMGCSAGLTINFLLSIHTKVGRETQRFKRNILQPLYQDIDPSLFKDIIH